MMIEYLYQQAPPLALAILVIAFGAGYIIKQVRGHNGCGVKNNVTFRDIVEHCENQQPALLIGVKDLIKIQILGIEKRIDENLRSNENEFVKVQTKLDAVIQRMNDNNNHVCQRLSSVETELRSWNNRHNGDSDKRQ